MQTRTLLLAIGIVLVGCPDPKDDTGGDTDTDTDTDTDADTDSDSDTDTAAPTYNVTGTAVDFASQTPAATGLCVIPVDPGPAVTGGDPIPLGQTTVGADGAFTLFGLTVKPDLGLVIIVQDCAKEGTVYPTGTGVKAATLEALADGATLADQRAFSVSNTFRDGLIASFGAAGGSWDPGTAGVLMGFVLDSKGAPIDGATVTGAASTTYYMDTNSADGLFTSSSGVNTATSAAASSVFAIPAAPVTVYTAAADGYTFEPLTGGSLPGIALFVAFFGT